METEAIKLVITQNYRHFRLFCSLMELRPNREAFFVNHSPEKVASVLPPLYEFWIQWNEYAGPEEICYNERMSIYIQRFRAQGGKIVVFDFNDGIEIIEVLERD